MVVQSTVLWFLSFSLLASLLDQPTEQINLKSLAPLSFIGIANQIL